MAGELEDTVRGLFEALDKNDVEPGIGMVSSETQRAPTRLRPAERGASAGAGRLEDRALPFPSAATRALSAVDRDANRRYNP